MQNYITAIEELWQTRDLLIDKNQAYTNAKQLIDEIMQQLKWDKRETNL